MPHCIKSQEFLKDINKERSNVISESSKAIEHKFDSSLEQIHSIKIDPESEKEVDLNEVVSCLVKDVSEESVCDMDETCCEITPKSIESTFPTQQLQQQPNRIKRKCIYEIPK